MSILIFSDGRPMTPEQAVREARPLDTELVCPFCESVHVRARIPKTVEQIVEDKTRSITGREFPQFVPRIQDRWCQDCGEKWQCVLPPTSYSDPSLLIRS